MDQNGDDAHAGNGIGLAAFVAELRSELAEVGRSESQVKLEVGPIDLELSLVTRRDLAGSGKVKIYVAEVGGSGSTSREQTQRVRFTLKPVTADGKDLKIADDAPMRPR